jgi:hypothetical protein
VGAVLAGCTATLLVLDGRCRVLGRLRALYEVWATAEVIARRSGAMK